MGAKPRPATRLSSADLLPSALLELSQLPGTSASARSRLLSLPADPRPPCATAPASPLLALPRAKLPRSAERVADLRGVRPLFLPLQRTCSHLTSLPFVLRAEPGEGGGSQDAPGTGKGWGRGRVAMPVEAGPPPQVIDPEDSSRAVKHKLDPSRMPRQLSESGAIPPRGPTSGTRTVSSPSGTSRHAPPPAAQDASRAPSSTAAPAPLRDAPPHVRTSPRAHSFTEQVRLKGPEQSHPPRVEPVASGSGTSGNYRNAPPPHGAAAGAGAADLAKATNTSPASQAPRPPRESPGRIYEADKPADSMRVRGALSLFPGLSSCSLN